MTPTIQRYEEQSMQMPPASVLYNNIFFQEDRHHLTSTSDRTNSMPGKLTISALLLYNISSIFLKMFILKLIILRNSFFM